MIFTKKQREDIVIAASVPEVFPTVLERVLREARSQNDLNENPLPSEPEQQPATKSSSGRYPVLCLDGRYRCNHKCHRHYGTSEACWASHCNKTTSRPRLAECKWT